PPSVAKGGGPQVELEGVVFATDGAYSGVRQHLICHPRVDYSQSFLDYGFKELTIPAAPGGAYRMESGGLHIWPRQNFLLIALPDVGGSFTATLFAPFSMLELPPEELFRQHFPDAHALLPDLAEQWKHPTGCMVTVRLSPWHWQDRVLLLGDAAHAIVPFFGQGMNCGFEDCTVLMDLLDRHGPDWAAVFPGFEELRKTNTDAIADLSLANLEEMKGRVDDPRFLLAKSVEKVLEREMPDDYVSAYSMIAHHRVPYRVALEAGELQRSLLEELTRGLSDAAQLDLGHARELVRQRLGDVMRQVRDQLVTA
ncbi:MAG: FAD-dependent monooxygenase, partial [Candidatus Eremiobacterota bacterium]